MDTVSKGNQLEGDFYDFLCDQRELGGLVYGVHAPQTCAIHHKKKYFCSERENHIEFDVVIEVTGEGRAKPALFVVFECKNHTGAVQERDVRDFSDKIRSVFGHAGKGILVFSSRLQTGAEKLCQSRRIGLAKFDKNGLEIKADRKGWACSEAKFVEKQFFEDESRAKSFKFSAFYNGRFSGSVDHLLQSIDPNIVQDNGPRIARTRSSVPFLSDVEIQFRAETLLAKAEHKAGPVDLVGICSSLSLSLAFSEQTICDSTGELILGSANFDSRSIEINFHENKQRQRFAIGHEIGHFYLGHGQYLRSEITLERDLLSSDEPSCDFSYERLERQANNFASDLLLPEALFLEKVQEFRESLEIKDRGHGYIYVDDQPCNFHPYNSLLLQLSLYFDVSRKAVEVKLKKLGLITDGRYSWGKA